MSPALPDVMALARVLLHNDGGGQAAETPVETAEQVLQRLGERLSPLVGAVGFHLLLQRALKRAVGKHAWLGAIEIAPDTPWRLAGAAEAAGGVTREEAASAAEALLAELIGLLARFLGADMAIRLVRQSFPDVRLGNNTKTGTEEIIHE